jgi:SAM-dependent methyltransferase
MTRTQPSPHRPYAGRRRALALPVVALLASALLAGAPPGACADAPALVEEVPFVVTPDAVTLAMLELAGVGPQDVLIDLGSGDGRIVINAAKRFGARGLGVEIVPDLVARSRAAAARAGVADRVRFEQQDLFDTDLAQASVITMYLLQEVNLRLRPRLLALAPGTRIVSHDWDLGDWVPDRTRSVDAPDKPVGREKLSRLHLWVVPARLQGLWCAAGGAGGVALQIDQRYQALQGSLTLGDSRWMLAGRIDGAAWQAQGAGGAALQARWQGAAAAASDRGELLVAQAAGPWAALQGARLRPAAGERCESGP